MQKDSVREQFKNMCPRTSTSRTLWWGTAPTFIQTHTYIHTYLHAHTFTKMHKNEFIVVPHMQSYDKLQVRHTDSVVTKNTLIYNVDITNQFNSVV